MAAFGGHPAGLDAQPGHPYRRGRLLQRPRPDVDVAVVEELAFPVERAVGRRHRLQDQVVRLPIAPHQIGRVAVRRCDLIGRALDEPHLEPAARQHVEPRHLLGDAHRVGAVGDRRAERQKPRALGLAGDDRQRHRHRHGQAGRGAVVLVDHDVEPDLVAQRELVEVAVQQLVADLRIVIAVRQIRPAASRASAPPPRPGGRPFPRNTRRAWRPPLSDCCPRRKRGRARQRLRLAPNAGNGRRRRSVQAGHPGLLGAISRHRRG